VVEGGGLENRCRATYRGFESHPLRQYIVVGYKERWLSGRKHVLAKDATGKLVRGFESHPLRSSSTCRIHNPLLTSFIATLSSPSTDSAFKYVCRTHDDVPAQGAGVKLQQAAERL